VRIVDGQTPPVPAWAVVREPRSAAAGFDRVIALPPGTPSLGGAAGMESAFFMSPPVERTVNELGQALVQEAA
jgi:hypothetical protein